MNDKPGTYVYVPENHAAWVYPVGRMPGTPPVPADGDTNIDHPYTD